VPVVSVIIGLLLTGLGLWGRFGTEEGAGHITPLIPAFLGGPLIALGLLALKEKYLKHAMHAAVLLGTLGFLAAVAQLVRKVIQGVSSSNPALWSLVGMIVLCGLFVALCVNSFIAARRRRRAREGLTSPAS